MRRRGLALGVAVITLVSACGSGGGDEAADEEQIKSPFAEFLGYDASLFGDSEAANAEFIEQERVRQEAVAACMKEQGFEYIPVDPAQYSSIEGPDGIEYGSDEWVAKYGFGITTQRWDQESLGPDLVGYDSSAFDEVTDPNQKLLEEMSPEEQEAYNTALYGDQSAFEIDETLSEEEQQAELENQTFEIGGCYGEAQNETDDLATRFYQEFQTELNDMNERVMNDPRIVEAETKVKDCVADKGLEYPGQEEVYSLWDAELNEIDAMIVQPGADLTEEDMAAMSQEELEQLFNQPIDFPDEARAKLAELQKQEIALAVAVNDCDGGFEDQNRLYQEVSAEYEQEFLDANADRLAELKA